MPIPQMLLQTGPEILGEADVVEPVLLVEGIDPMSTANVVTNDVLVLFQQLGRKVFQVLADQWCMSCHIRVIPRVSSLDDLKNGVKEFVDAK